MREEYEVISHNLMNFHVFLVNLLYRTPHVHKDYEICLLLDGALTVTAEGADAPLIPGDIFLMNPFQSHELKAKTPALILSLQVSPSFFASYFPQIDNIQFSENYIYKKETPDVCEKIRQELLQIASAYFHQKDLHELECAMRINSLFYLLLDTLPYALIPEKEMQASRSRGLRMRKITKYIDAHYEEKLLLSDIAAAEGLDLYYLSHFFKESFGVTFQDYLLKIRCEHARQLLLTTELSLLDVSISCGFSDPKYFNRGFLRQFGCTPKEYRKQFRSEELAQQQRSMLTTQEFLPPSASLITLERYGGE